MAEKIWYYEKSGGSTGPVSEEVMIELIDHGIITRDTLVWRSPLDKWVTAIEVKAFNAKLLEVHTPPPLPGNQPDIQQAQSADDNNPFQSPGTEQNMESNPFAPPSDNLGIPIERTATQEEPINLDETIFEAPQQAQNIADYKGEDGVYVNQVRPWIRYFARQYDYYTFTLVAIAISLFTIMDLVGLETLSYLEILMIAVVLDFLWVFFEALFLSLFGTTPGKYVFGISVLTKDEKKLSFEQALGRSFSVWFKGMGMALPVFVLIANIFGYIHLSENKITSWDRDSKSTTVHDEYNIFFVILYPIIVTILIGIVGAVSMYVP